jgi:hypothetical protein
LEKRHAGTLRAKSSSISTYERPLVSGEKKKKAIAANAARGPKKRPASQAAYTVVRAHGRLTDLGAPSGVLGRQHEGDGVALRVSVG